MSSRPGTVHECPPPGSAHTACCLRTPTELPLPDLYTRDPQAVTCTVRALRPVDTDDGESPFGWRDLPQ